MRHKTPVGSMTTKSRIPHGLSAGGSALTSYLETILGLNVAPPSVDVLDQQMHHEVVGVFLVVEFLQEEALNLVSKVSQIVR
jgi:hypothetical protein